MKALDLKPKTLFKVKRFLKSCGINMKDLSNIDVGDAKANAEVFQKVMHAIEDFEDLETDFYMLLSEVLCISTDQAEELTLKDIGLRLRGLIDTTDKKAF